MKRLSSLIPLVGGRRKPEIVKNRWAELRIYKVVNNRMYTTWVVAWREGKHRRRKGFADHDEAREFAHKQLKLLSDGMADETPLLSREVAYYRMCERELSGVSLAEVIAFYKEAKKKEAEAAHKSSATVQDAHKRYMELLEGRYTKDDQRDDHDRHVETTRNRLKPLVDNFHVPMDSVTTEALLELIKKKSDTWGPRTKNNFRAAVSSFYLWANKTEPKMATTNPASRIPTYKELPKDPEIFTPDEMKAMLKACPEKWRPYFVIAGFCGVRACELKRMKWSDVCWEQQTLLLTSKITKKCARRAVPLPPNAMRWLAPYRKWTGKIVPNKDINKATAKVSEDSEVAWRNNGLRHSAITYLMAKLGNAPLVAEHSGNSESEVQRSYKAAVPPSESEKWFAIFP